jgi:hypothetical protein
MSEYAVLAMSRLSGDDLHLPLAIMISDAPPDKKEPRVKVAKSTGDFKNKRLNFSMTISEHPHELHNIPKGISPKEVSAVRSWVARNRSVLLKYWYGLLTNTRQVEDLLIAEHDIDQPFADTVHQMRTLWFDGEKVKEIATQLKLPVNSVKLIVHTNKKLFSGN